MGTSVKELLKSKKKYYIIDLGIKNYILLKKRYDLVLRIMFILNCIERNMRYTLVKIKI
jgi:hypothetical protein